MSFRDIHAFNHAILAKQAWRLIQGTHSLFFRVYKACYFPNCSFMEAELGNNPSARQAEQVEHSSARQDKKLWNRILQLQVTPPLRLERLSGGRAPIYSQPARFYAKGRSL